VDLVDEENVLLLEPGEDRGHVALLLERRAGDRADADAELLSDDLRQRRLAEPGRADEQDVVERLPARLGRRERDRELLLDALLPDELVELARTQRALELLLLGTEDLCRDGAHQAACLSASRTRSSAGRSGSIDASACSASSTE
jgi:hypothetical protein